MSVRPSQTPRAIIVVLRDERADGGGVRAVHDLLAAELRAVLNDIGVSIAQFVDPEVTTLARAVRALRRSGAEWSLFETAGAPAIAAALARAVVADGALQVALLGDDASPRDWPDAPRVAQDPAAVAALLGAPSPSHERPGASPWLTGLLPARSAPDVGVRAAGVAPDRVLAELEWLESHTPSAIAVPLRGVPDDALCAALVGWHGDFVRLRAELDAATATPCQVTALALAGIAEIVLLARSAGDITPTAELARAGAPASLSLRLELSGDEVADTRAIRAAAAAGSVFTVTGGDDELAVPEMQASASWPQRAAALAGDAQRLDDALTGTAGRGAPALAEAVDILLWEHDDPPAAHAAWLAELLSTRSSLFVFSDAPDVPLGAAPAPLRTLQRITAQPAGGEAVLWQAAGHTWLVRPYAERTEAVPEGRLVLTLDRPRDLAKFLADADTAHSTGTLPAAVARPDTVVRDAASWAGPGEDATPALNRLWLSADGLLRPTPAAAPIGRLGDPLHVLRATLRERLAILDRDLAAGPPGGWVSLALPAWVEPAQARAWIRERPWLIRWAQLGLALRARRRGASGAPEPGSVRLSGFGGRLLYDGPVSGEGSPRLLLAAGGRHILYDPLSGQALTLTADLAAIWEGLDATGGAAEPVVGWLVERRGLTARDAERGVATAARRLQLAGMLGAVHVSSEAPAEAPPVTLPAAP